MKLEKLRFSDNSKIVNLGSWAEGPYLQTTPPTIKIEAQYPDGDYPVGII